MLDRNEFKGFPNLLGEVVFLRTYSKVLDDGKNETWPQTVDRYLSYLTNRCKLNNETIDLIRSEMLSGGVVPSMRLTQYSGNWIDRFEAAAYNCSYLGIRDLDAFHEVLYLSMIGTGVGFSVESNIVSMLPKVSDEDKGSYLIHVEDNTESWVSSFREAIYKLWEGYDLQIDVSKLRPRGSKISSGGFSAGKEGFSKLITEVSAIVKLAKGRKLTSIEVYDLVCWIGFCVSNSGSRRVALLSISDLHDQEMRNAKIGHFYKDNPQRTMTNNSYRIPENVNKDEFFKEWQILQQSGTGERGLCFPRRHNLTEVNGPEPIDLPKGTNPCGEIELEDRQFCNLTEVFARPNDNLEDLKKKVKVATILGTYQASLTEFDTKFLSPEWKRNCERDALLGVSITGIVDCPTLNNSENLKILRQHAREVNKLWAKKIGIRPSVAITCVKPSGTASILWNVSQGIHPRYSPYYIRRVRFNKNSRLVNLLGELGLKVENDVYSTENKVVEFVIKSPESSKFNMTSLEQLDLWTLLKRHYTDHNPSMTCYIEKGNWEKVGNKVWDIISNIGILGGISFFPKDDSVYQQAPLESCDEVKYLEFKRLEDKVWPLFKEKAYSLLTEDMHNTSGCDSESCG